MQGAQAGHTCHDCQHAGMHPERAVLAGQALEGVQAGVPHKDLVTLADEVAAQRAQRGVRHSHSILHCTGPCQDVGRAGCEAPPAPLSLGLCLFTEQ